MQMFVMQAQEPGGLPAQEITQVKLDRVQLMLDILEVLRVIPGDERTEQRSSESLCNTRFNLE